jgi:pyridoxal phosphate enzyme (YggS family)
MPARKAAELEGNLAAVRARIEAAERRCGRPPGAVALLAVSKGAAPEDIRDLAGLGQRRFGESYLSEALPKMAALADLGLEWHFIGPVQSNKTRAIAGHFAWVHGVDRLKVAERLSAQRPPEAPPLQVCVQVNVSGEPGKSGVAPEEAGELVRQAHRLPRLAVRGLMTIPAPETEFDRQYRACRLLADVFDRLRAQGLALDTLSMGMSGDLEAAIAAGSTCVRIGRALFGERRR